MQYAAVKDEAKYVSLMEFLKNNLGDRPLGFDIETGYIGPDKAKQSLDPRRAMTVGFSLSWRPGAGVYIPVLHDDPADNINMSPDDVWRLFKPIAENSNLVIHHRKFESKFMRRVGISPNCLDDTALSALHTGKYEVHDLKTLSFVEFGYKQMNIKDLFKKVGDARGFKVTDKWLQTLRFNWLPGLAVAPPAAIRPVEVAPGVTFIGLDPGGQRRVVIRYDP